MNLSHKTTLFPHKMSRTMSGTLVRECHIHLKMIPYSTRFFDGIQKYQFNFVGLLIIPEVKPLLDELRNKGVLIREGVYQETLRQAGEL